MALIQKANYIKRALGILGLLISVIFIIRFSDLVAFLFAFADLDFVIKYMRTGNYLEPEKITIVTLSVLIILFSITISVFFILNLWRKIPQFFNTCFQTANARRFFLTDDICRKQRLSLYILVIGIMFGFGGYLSFLVFGWPPHEGPIEKCQAILFLLSALICIISITIINQMTFSSGTRKKIIFSLIAMSASFIYIFGEEISWGQRIFGWNSFGIFKEYNFQQETNTHNFLNPFLLYIYPLVGMSSFILLFFMWFFPNKRKSYLFKLFLPHPSLFPLLFLMACSSIMEGSSIDELHELYEGLLALFVLLYSIRILICLSFPKIDLSSQMK